MSLAEPFPLYFPGDARRPFSSDAATRRFAKVAQLEEGGRVLVLGGGSSSEASLLLARDFGCSVLTVDVDEALLEPLRARVQSLGLEAHVQVQHVAPDALGLPEGEFDAILSHGRLLPLLPTALRTLRPLLAHQGRVGLTWPVRVGREQPPAVGTFWEQRLGLSLLLPRELLQLLAQSGFEPESAESLQPSELEALYRELEPHLGPAPSEQARVLRDEVSLFREHSAQAFSYAFVIGRRKEPGERPPATRDNG
jgi:cyclopropane fatty-acyl-phospholipid synthase-like methyltransferase